MDCIGFDRNELRESGLHSNVRVTIKMEPEYMKASPFASKGMKAKRLRMFVGRCIFRCNGIRQCKVRYLLKWYIVLFRSQHSSN